MNNTFYTYLLIDSRTNLPFYVGKGKRNRMYCHVRQTLRNKVVNGNLKKYNKIKSIFNNGGKVIYKKFVNNVSEQVAFNFEILLIKKYGRNNLCNLTDGGEGMSNFIFSKETRKKMSDSRKGIKFSKEHKRNISLAKKGKKFSKKHRDNISKGLVGIKKSEETKIKMSLNHHLNNGGLPRTGYEHSKESKRKMSLAKIGIEFSKEHRKKLSDSHKGKVAWNKGLLGYNKGRIVSKETKKKLSLAKIKYYKKIA